MGILSDLENLFYLRNKKKTINKIRSFINPGRDKIHLLFDFDKTITTGEDMKRKGA